MVVEHEGDAPGGLLDGWAADRALAVTVVRLHAGDALPEAAACDAAVLLGSDQTAYDDRVPWLGRELSFLERLLAGSVPVLGICFGAQLLARALGARLYRLPAPEIGWSQVTSHHPGVAEGPWLSWHRDAFTLPASATELAVNEVSVQAFSFGQHAGVQFHPEATAPIARSWLANSRPPPGPDVAGPLFGDDAESAWKQASVHASVLFSAWLDGRLALAVNALPPAVESAL